jgi:hypothetical protein
MAHFGLDDHPLEFFGEDFQTDKHQDLHEGAK